MKPTTVKQIIRSNPGEKRSILVEEQNNPASSTMADYYFDQTGNLVYTAKYLCERGYCCGNGCMHCPYLPWHRKGNRRLAVK